MVSAKSDAFDNRIATLAKLAKALSHPARIAILETLAKRNSCICGEIVDILPLAQSTVSQHLKELKDADLITGEIDGLKSCYCLNHKAIREMSKLLAGFVKHLDSGCSSNKCC